MNRQELIIRLLDIDMLLQTMSSFIKIREVILSCDDNDPSYHKFCDAVDKVAKVLEAFDKL